MEDKEVRKVKKILEEKPEEKGSFSHINTETTSLNTKGSSGISDSFAKELGLSNRG
jgi:hypothetical protein